MDITLYTPERETYIVDEACMIQKVEKIMIKASEEDTSVAYVCYDIHGYREVVEEIDASPFFMELKSASIPEDTMEYLLSLVVDGAESEIIDQLRDDYGIKTVIKNDGSIVSLEDCMN